MPRPRAVQQQVEQSNKAAKELASQMAKEAEDRDELIRNLPGDEPAEPAPQADTHEGEDVTALKEELRKANERYHTLTRKYDAEVPRFARENKALTDEVRSLKDEVQRLKDAVQASADDPKEQSSEEILKELKEDFPESLVDGIYKAFQAELKKVSANARPPHQPAPEAEETPEQKETKRKRELFQELFDLVPNWQQLEKDPAFAEFIQEPGVFRSTIDADLSYVFLELEDVRATANIYRRFIERQTARKGRSEGDLEPDSQGASNEKTGKRERKVTMADVDLVAQMIQSARSPKERKELSARHNRLLRALEGQAA